MASMQEGQKQGILVGIAEEITYRASLERSKNMWIVFMAIAKGIHVK